MKQTTILSAAVALMLLSGCGGGGGGSNPNTPPDTPTQEAKPAGIPANQYQSTICTDKNSEDDTCKDLAGFDLSKETAAVLEAPKDIGASPFEYFEGKRVVIVPKDEKEISPLHMLAYGLYLYAQQKGGEDDWCGPCRMAAPSSYAEALQMLKTEFKLTGTPAQNEAILEAFNANLERLGAQGMDLKRAVYADIKAMAESLVNLTVKGEFPDLSGLHPVKKNGKVIGSSIMAKGLEFIPPDDGRHTPYLFGIDQENAIDLARENAHQTKTPYYVDTVLEGLTCEDTQRKHIYLQGDYDGFDPTNIEVTHPRAALSAALVAPPSMVHDYDYPADEYHLSLFRETLLSLPTNMTAGLIAIGLRENRSEKQGYTDAYMIGSGIGSANFVGTGGLVRDLRNSWDSPATDVYVHDLSTLPVPAGQPSVLSTIQSGQDYLDVAFISKTNIDFIAIAVCIPEEQPDPDPKPDPLPPVKLECKGEIGEQLYTVTGGVDDNYGSGVDPANPSATLSTLLGSTIAYDEPIEKAKTFADTLAHPNTQITQLELVVKSRTTAAASASIPQKILAGSVSAGRVAIKQGAFPHSTSLHYFSGSDTVYDSSGTPQGTLLSLLNSSNQGIDLVAMAQTEVDTVRLAACVVKGDTKDGDIGIEKKLIRSYDRGGLHYGVFGITFSGTLPVGEDLSFEDAVPTGADITHINAGPWSCTPTPIISGGQTLSCTLTGYYSPIPPIEVTMRTQEDKPLENCAGILTKEERPYFNSDPENDKSCDTLIPPITDTPDPRPKSCSELVKLDLRPASSWIDPAGNPPTEHNVFATYPPHPSWGGVIWDGAMNWFDYGSAGNAVHPLSIDFCACGPTQITIDELKSDNFSKIYLDDDPTPTSYTNAAYIANRSNGISQSTMASWGPSVGGSLHVPAPVSATDHTLHFDVKNGFGPSGGAVDGTLSFIGHLGACTPEDNGTSGTPSDPSDPTDPNWTVIYMDLNVTVTDVIFTSIEGDDENGTIVIDLAGSIATVNDYGKLIVDNDPHIVIDTEHVFDLNMSRDLELHIDNLIHALP